MPTRLDTINLALIELGENPFPQPTGGQTDDDVLADALDDAERRVVEQYEPVARLLMEAATWRWAVQWVKLTPRPTSPGVNWQFMYALPDDWLSTVSLAEGDETPPAIGPEYTRPDFRYEVVQDFIYSDYERLWLAYISDVLDPGDWSYSFQKAVACELALRVSRNVRPSGRTQQELAAMAQDALRNAKRKDSLDNTATFVPPSRWGLSRLGGYGQHNGHRNRR